MPITRPLRALACAGLAMLAGPAALAQDDPRIPPRQVYQAMLDAAQTSGWVQFRDYDGRQLVYFTALQTLHCRLAEIRYSINSDGLNQTFPLVDCNPQLPLALPSDARPSDIYLSLAPDSVDFVAVQVIWSDGEESPVRRYKPCDNVGDSTCAAPVE